jgi:hypothetical protein
MLNIKENYGTFLSMIFKTLDRKSVTDKEARMNYKQVLLDYCFFLYSLTPLNITPQSPLRAQYEYGEKLDILLGRYLSIGDEFLSDDKVESFLVKIQDMMRDYLHQDLDIELYKAEHEHYTDGAWKYGSNKGTQSEWTWQEDKADTIKSALERHKDLAFKNLG